MRAALRRGSQEEIKQAAQIAAEIIKADIDAGDP
jgi:hypothetical protein